MADDSKLRTQRSDAHRADAGFAERPDQATSKDPLAELARLIGQDDLFEQMRKDAARAGGAPAAATARHAEPSLAAEPRAPALDAYHDLRGSFDPDPVAPMPAEEPVRRAASYRAAARQPVPAAEERYEESYQQEAHQEPSHDPAYAYPPHDDRSYSDPHAQSAHAGYADPAYDPAYPYDEQAYAEEPPPPERRRGGMMMVAAVLGLAVVGTAGAFAYRAISGPGGSEPPVIQASGAPKKVAPSPQAREQANRSFDRSGGTQPERMVSREEQPVELRESRGTPARMLGSGSPAITGTVGPAAQGAAPMMAAAGSQGIAAPAGEAKKVKTIPIRPEGAAGRTRRAADGRGRSRGGERTGDAHRLRAAFRRRARRGW
jgi:hypothetical protein